VRSLTHEFATVKPAAFLPGRDRADCQQDVDDKEKVIRINDLTENLATAIYQEKEKDVSKKTNSTTG
jgi:hypothetical protein